MDQNVAIKCLTAISHDGRLSLIRRLIKAGPAGMSSGELAAAEKIKASTASAQLLVLLNCGLVSANRQGKQMIYRAHFDQFQSLIAFLMEDCCSGATGEP